MYIALCNIIHNERQNKKKLKNSLNKGLMLFQQIKYKNIVLC